MSRCPGRCPSLWPGLCPCVQVSRCHGVPVRRSVSRYRCPGPCPGWCPSIGVPVSRCYGVLVEWSVSQCRCPVCFPVNVPVGAPGVLVKVYIPALPWSVFQSVSWSVSPVYTCPCPFGLVSRSMSRSMFSGLFFVFFFFIVAVIIYPVLVLALVNVILVCKKMAQWMEFRACPIEKGSFGVLVSRSVSLPGGVRSVSWCSGVSVSRSVSRMFRSLSWSVSWSVSLLRIPGLSWSVSVSQSVSQRPGPCPGE